jgi:metal-responsive CopG/Arc/MetJ family transcriptional regulator
MAELARIGVAISQDLLEELDRLIASDVARTYNS